MAQFARVAEAAQGDGFGGFRRDLFGGEGGPGGAGFVDLLDAVGVEGAGCCYILLAFIAKYPFKERRKWARNSIIIAFGVWVIIDSSMCVHFGVYPQIYIINAFSITVKALPIIFTWEDF